MSDGWRRMRRCQAEWALIHELIAQVNQKWCNRLYLTLIHKTSTEIEIASFIENKMVITRLGILQNHVAASFKYGIHTVYRYVLHRLLTPFMRY